MSTAGKTLPTDLAKSTRIPVTAIVLTYNEEQNLPPCITGLAALANEVFVVDSGSTDGTLEIANRHATVAHHQFETHARQWAWALENLPISNQWVLALDADQQITPELHGELVELFQPGNSALADADGIFIKRRQVFRGRWIKHGGYYPKYLLKLFRVDKVRFDPDDLVDHHFYIPGKTLQLKHDIIESNVKENRIAFWVEKHNRYAAALAREELDRRRLSKASLLGPALLGNPDQRILWFKRLWYRSPGYIRPSAYFLYRYFLRLGFLDGKEGFIFHFLQGFWFRLLIDINLEELASTSKQ